jgi:NUMOD4 motif/HNH endonuclease
MQTEFTLFDDGACMVASTEEWKPVVGFLRYEVSTLGRFRRLSNGKYLEGTFNHNGYIHIGLTRNGRQVTKLAHRLIAETFLEPASKLHSVVNHKNKNRVDNRLSNLEWATRSYNSWHSKQK